MWVVFHSCFFFFFKQKTAYEMRISDWSSDVCSSDLMFDPTGRLHHKSRRNAVKDRADISLDGLFLRIDRIAAGRQRGVEAGQTEGRGERDRASRRANRHAIGRATCRERVCQYV